MLAAGYQPFCFALTFAHLAFWAADILFRAAAVTLRRAACDEFRASIGNERAIQSLSKDRDPAISIRSFRLVYHKEIADRAGVTLGDIDSLLRGTATKNVADRMDVSIGDIEDFVRGTGTAAMTSRPGFDTMAATEELARCMERAGAIGIY